MAAPVNRFVMSLTTNGDTLADRYEQTMLRLEQITRAGYHVKVQWECEFDDACIATLELLDHPTVCKSLLSTRDALYGGRTEAMRLHWEGENIQYLDFMSLYPYICKYFNFPVGHPVIHVGNACKDREACLRKEGLMKCSIVPPEKFIILCYTSERIRNSFSDIVEHVL